MNDMASITNKVRLLRIWKENGPIVSAMIERNMIGRYRNSYIGIGWNFIMPVLLLIAMYVTFVSIKAVHLEANYWIYLSVGVFMITCCSSCLRGRTFFNNSNYVKKMAVPKWIIVLTDVISQFIVLLISYAILIVLIMVTGNPLDASTILFLPLEIILLFLMCMGMCFIFSTISVIVNDIGYLMSIVARMAIWLTPVFFYLSDVNETLQLIATFNPFTYFIEPLHQMMAYGEFPELSYVAVSTMLALSIFCIGWIVFKHYEKRLPEML